VRARVIAKLKAARSRRQAVAKALKRAQRATFKDKALIANHQSALATLDQTVKVLRGDIADATNAISDLRQAAADAAQKAAGEAEDVPADIQQVDYTQLPTDIEELGVLADATTGTSADDLSALQAQESYYTGILASGVPLQGADQYSMLAGLTVPLSDEQRVATERNLNQVRSQMQAIYDARQQASDDAAKAAKDAAAAQQQAADDAAAAYEKSLTDM